MRIMREILFRGFSVEDDEWHYGNLNTTVKHGKLLCIISDMDDLNKYYYVDGFSVGQFISQ